MSAFHGEPRPVAGLGLLPWSNCVHFGGEREHAYRRMLRDGMCLGYAAQDGAALHFEGEPLARVVTSRAHACAYRMCGTGGRVRSRTLPSVYLGEPMPADEREWAGLAAA